MALYAQLSAIGGCGPVLAFCDDILRVLQEECMPAHKKLNRDVTAGIATTTATFFLHRNFGHRYVLTTESMDGREEAITQIDVWRCAPENAMTQVVITFHFDKDKRISVKYTNEDGVLFETSDGMAFPKYVEVYSSGSDSASYFF